MVNNSKVRYTFTPLMLALGAACCLSISLPAMSANATPAKQSVEVSSEKSRRTEKAFDDFLSLYSQDRVAAKAVLDGLFNSELSVQQRIRALNYKMLYAPEEAKAILSEMSQWARASTDVHAHAEMLTAHLQHYHYSGEGEVAASYVPTLQAQMDDVTDPRIAYVAWHTLADFRAWQGKHDDALTAYLSALSVLEKDQSPRAAARKLSLKGSVAALHTSMRNYHQALEVLKQSLDELYKTPGMADQASGLHMQMGMVYIDLKEWEKAEEHYLTALTYAQQQNDSNYQSTIYNNLGDLYLRQRNLEKAMGHFNLSLKAAGENVDPGLKALLIFNIGQVMVLQEQFDDGLSVMEESLLQLATLSAQNDYLNYLLEMADSYLIAGRYQKEAKTLRAYHALSETLFTAERERQINLLQQEFLAKEREKAIASLTQENTLTALELERKTLQQGMLALIILVAFLAAVLLWLFYLRSKQANQKLEEINVRLADQSMRDPLTGLLNRRSLQQYMQQKENDRRNPMPALTDGFILLDIDFFKHINDHYGHAAGDAVLIELASRLKKQVRADDLVLRWGGEEFLIVLRRVEISELMQFTQKVLDVVAMTPVFTHNHALSISASAGVIAFPFVQESTQSLDWQKTLQLADNALYLSKVHGRNRAYGLKALNVPYEQVSEQLTHDFSVAVSEGLVDVICVTGPQGITFSRPA